MKKLLIILFLFSTTDSFSQTKSSTLKISSITEYSDAYVIKAVDSTNLHTLNIISIKNVPKYKKGFKKMMVGKSYNFIYEENNIAPQILLENHFVIKVKNTLIWKPSDGLENLPVYSNNTEGIWINEHLLSK
jgi:hypothetical protein